MEKQAFTFTVHAGRPNASEVDRSIPAYVNLTLSGLDSDDVWEGLGVNPGTTLRFVTEAGTKMVAKGSDHSLSLTLTKREQCKAIGFCYEVDLVGSFEPVPTKDVKVHTGPVSL